LKNIRFSLYSVNDNIYLTFQVFINETNATPEQLELWNVKGNETSEGETTTTIMTFSRSLDNEENAVLFTVLPKFRLKNRHQLNDN